MAWLLIGYMFLFIDRPFEVWPWLGDLHVERFYMLFTLAVWAVHPGKRFLPNLQYAAYAFFGFAVLAGWLLSPWSEAGQPIVEDYFKIVIFYVLLVTSIHDEKNLRRLVVGFVAVMGLYLTHSLREYLGGRHTFRMGIARMIGVDSTLGDPNSFGASIVFALPFVPALWRSGIGGRSGRYALAGYLSLSVLCILLTGSRSSLLGLVAWSALTLCRVRRAWLWLLLGLAAAPVGFMILPESLQTRFETIVNSDAGPENAKQSGEGRIEGFLTGMELWAAHPISGIGPGAWRPATQSSIESHNLYGQLAGELGTLGVLSFACVLLAFIVNLRAMKALRRERPEMADDFEIQVAGAVGTSLLLLLFMGCFGHNLFRFTWLWYGGFLVIARHCVFRRIATDEAAAVEDQPHDLIDGWVWHPPHADLRQLSPG